MAKKNIENKVDGVLTPACIHDRYCHKLQMMPKAHCSADYVKACGQVFRFYDKYGEDGNHLGVGC